MITSKPDRKHRVIERRIETLEDRICLTAAVDVIRGDLLVRGDSDGDVEINALGEGVYEVTDNGGVGGDRRRSQTGYPNPPGHQESDGK